MASTGYKLDYRERQRALRKLRPYYDRCPMCGVELMYEDKYYTDPRDGRRKPRPDSAEVDHRWPGSKGGTKDLGNLQILCRKCNRAKSDKTYGKPPEKPKQPQPVVWSDAWL